MDVRDSSGGFALCRPAYVHFSAGQAQQQCYLSFQLRSSLCGMYLRGVGGLSSLVIMGGRELLMIYTHVLLRHLSVYALVDR